MNGKFKQYGFTFIELILVMAVVGLIIGLVTPNYFKHLQQSQETVLKNNLQIMRRSINDYYADNGDYPISLEALVTKRYLKSIPQDPLTKLTTTWKIIPPPAGSGVYDVLSGATGNSLKGIPYEQL